MADDQLQTPVNATNFQQSQVRPGFMRGWMNVLGNRVLEQHEDERAQQQMERQHFWEAMNDPSLASQPGDTPEMVAEKKRRLDFAQQEFQKRAPKGAKPLIQSFMDVVRKLHGHQSIGAGAEGADTSQGGGIGAGATGAGAANPQPSPTQAAAAPAAGAAGVSPPPMAQAASPQMDAGVAAAMADARQRGVEGYGGHIAPADMHIGGSASPAPSAAPAPSIGPPPQLSGADLAAGKRYDAAQFGLGIEKQKAQQAQDIETAGKLKVAGGLAKYPMTQFDPNGGMRTVFRSETGKEIGDPVENALPNKLIGMGMIHPVTIQGEDGQPIPALQNKFTGEVYDQNLNAIPNAKVFSGSLVGRDTVQRDQYGNVITTNRRPVLGAAKTAGGVGGESRAIGGSGGAARPAGRTGTGAGAGGAGATGRTPAVLPPLDTEGHIPNVQFGGWTPQNVEDANRLLDGADVKDIPSKGKERAGQLARSYGWSQGKFTPKEQTQIREAATFLHQAINDPALAALDAGAMDRMQLAQVTRNPDKEGMLGTGLSTLAAQNMNPQQASFVRMYNQLVGTISGLSKLVRPGSTTEAQIERLKAELPNPVTTKNSADGRARLQRLLQEIDVAVAKGSFGDAGMTGGGKKSTGGGGGMVMARDPQGKLHEAPAGTPIPKGWTLDHAAAAQ